MTETIGFRVTAARRTRFERVTRRTMYFLRPRTYLPHRGCLYRRSTITVTLFIILLDTTTPFSGFTISARRRRAERPRVRWREGTCARLRRARECVSRRARASRRSRLGTRARLSSTGGCAATLVDARIPPSHHPPARGEGGRQVDAQKSARARSSSRATTNRRPARDQYCSKFRPPVYAFVNNERRRTVVLYKYQHNTHSRVAAISRRSTPPIRGASVALTPPVPGERRSRTPPRPIARR